MQARHGVGELTKDGLSIYLFSAKDRVRAGGRLELPDSRMDLASRVKISVRLR